MRTKTMNKITKEKFLNLLEEAGMDKKSFAKELGYQIETIEKWYNLGQIPRYIEKSLFLAVKAKKYQDYINNKRNSNIKNELKNRGEYEMEKLKQELILLKEENDKLKNTIIDLVSKK